MSVRLVIDGWRDRVALYDSVTGWAFGPVFEGDDAEEQAESFVAYIFQHTEKDPRQITEPKLAQLHRQFAAERAAA